MDSRQNLETERATFRTELAKDCPVVPRNFPGRIAVVLSGGGALGAYQAGALLAFQDAGLPTPIIAATSIGSINAASYAAHSDTVVGNAEPMVEAWLGLTSPAVGIEWTHYAWMLAGLVAAAAGLGNIALAAVKAAGISLHLHHPIATWLTLVAAGTAVLMFSDHLPYVFHAGAAVWRRSSWHFNRRRLALSVVANVLVLASLVALLDPVHLHAQVPELLRGYPLLSLFAVAAVLLLARPSLKTWAGPVVKRLLRLPLRSGLFSNFERTGLLANHIPADGLRAAPIRLLVTATDLGAGVARYFSNFTRDQLAADPGADPSFVTSAVYGVEDLMPAILASSAVPIIYEPIVVDGRAHADGAIAASQPLLPAVRLGADVIFVVNLDPLAARRAGGNTFIDVGLQALALMMSWALVADIHSLERINAWCKRAASGRGLEPEQVALDIGGRRFRHVELFRIQPEASLSGAVLDFGGRFTGGALLQGYRDAAAQVLKFRDYARLATFEQPRTVVEVNFGSIGAAL